MNTSTILDMPATSLQAFKSQAVTAEQSKEESMVSLNLYGAINHRADYHSCPPTSFVSSSLLVQGRFRHYFSKDMLIGFLLHLDGTPPSFRFLGLPLELRLHVCRELLWAPNIRQGRRLYPEILRNTKQVHDEGETVLYYEDVLHVEVTRRWNPMGFTATRCDVLPFTSFAISYPGSICAGVQAWHDNGPALRRFKEVAFTMIANARGVRSPKVKLLISSFTCSLHN